MTETAASPKQKFPRADAIAVARELCAALEPACERIIVAGSLRRRKSEVGDVEILYIPRRAMRVPPGEIFPRMTNLADAAIDALLDAALLTKRASKTSAFAWGEKNKLALHVGSGIPVDLFAATPDNWFNYLVCRTGPAENNVTIAAEARRRGWQWNPYGSGFTRLTGEPEEYQVESEQDVFRFVGLSYLEPWDR